MKYTVQLLTSLGIPTEDIEKIQALNDDKPQTEADAIITPIIEAIEAKNKDVYQNDSTFIKGIRDKKAGQVWGEYMKNISKEFGLNSEETKEVKTDLDLLRIVRSKLEKPGDHVETINKLREELASANSKIETFEKETIPSLTAKAESDFKMLQTKTSLKSYIRKFKLTADTEFNVNGFADTILKDHQVQFDSAGEPIFLNLDGTKAFDGKEQRGKKWMLSEGEKLGVFAVSNGKPEGSEGLQKTKPEESVKTGNPFMSKNLERSKMLVESQEKILKEKSQVK